MNNNLSKISRNITIIIVTFKSEDIIEECLNNLGKQNKIIIVENSSNKQLRYKIKKHYKNVDFIINKTNLGISKSWNIGIKKTKTKYALIMNPDSFPEKNCIKELYLTAEKKKNSSIIFPLNTDKKGRISDEFGIFTSNGLSKCKIKNGLNKIDWCNGNLMLINKDSLNKIGLFDENFFFRVKKLIYAKELLIIIKKIILIQKQKIFI